MLRNQIERESITGGVLSSTPAASPPPQTTAAAPSIPSRLAFTRVVVLEVSPHPTGIRLGVLIAAPVGLIENPFGKPTALRPSRGRVERHAVMALPLDQLTIDTVALAAGKVVARIDADTAFAPLGLSAGSNYLWVDGKGPPENRWRGVTLSADGTTRVDLVGFKYTRDTQHSNAGGPLGHARLYCNG